MFFGIFFLWHMPFLRDLIAGLKVSPSPLLACVPIFLPFYIEAGSQELRRMRRRNADTITAHFYICNALRFLDEQLFTVAVHEMWHMLVGLVVGGEIISICIVSR
jgi:hypothetical protein